MLLEAAYAFDPQARPWGLHPRGIPTLERLSLALVEAFHERVLPDEALFLPERFPEVAAGIEALRARYRNRTDWINRKLLEAAFPDAIERSHAPYRERLTGLIQVLRRGASTRRGIVDIVAANLGILGDDPAARRARAQIEIEEFRPHRVEFFAGEVAFWRPFPVSNPNPESAAPEVRVAMLPGLGRSLANLRITDARTDASVQFGGRFRPQDHLVLKGSTVLVNGITAPQALSGRVPEVPEDDTEWRFDADVVVPVAVAGRERELPIARFDRALDRSDPATEKPLGTFDNAVLAPSRPVVTVQVSSYRPDPGIFTVVIPWEIPGFTDKFDAQDHPRQQIRGLVDRVKAAGVQALVAYKLVFDEPHSTDASLRHLTVEGALLADGQTPATPSGWTAGRPRWRTPRSRTRSSSPAFSTSPASTASTVHLTSRTEGKSHGPAGTPGRLRTPHPPSPPRTAQRAGGAAGSRDTVTTGGRRAPRAALQPGDAGEHPSRLADRARRATAPRPRPATPQLRRPSAYIDLEDTQEESRPVDGRPRTCSDRGGTGRGRLRREAAGGRALRRAAAGAHGTKARAEAARVVYNRAALRYPITPSGRKIKTVTLV